MKFYKWLLFIVAGIIIGLSVLLTMAYLVTEYQRNQVYTPHHGPISYDLSDEEMLLRGKHIATIRQCVDCHGEGLAGKITYEDAITGLVVSTNLTTGEGGVGDLYSDEALIGAIRSGLDHRGKPTAFMPSDEYTRLDRDDISALIAYIRNLDPVDNVLPKSRIGLLARVGHLLLPSVELFNARTIDHTQPIPEPVADRTPLEMGDYLAIACSGCHGAGFSGGRILGVPPEWPEASNLTPAGSIGSWDLDDFVKAMRTGTLPNGHNMNSEYMPWNVYQYMTDEELNGLFIYLQSLPPKETGNR